MTRRIFGAQDGDPPQPPLPPPHPREDLDHVAAALEICYTACELGQLDDTLRHFVTLDEDSPANRLHAQIIAAYEAARVPDPPRNAFPANTTPIPFSVYDTADGDDPLPVLLGPPGNQQRVTVIPAGRTDWRLADDVHVSAVYPGQPAQPDEDLPPNAPRRDPAPL